LLARERNQQVLGSDVAMPELARLVDGDSEYT
jgi:hypothetical protein